jgi:hypothetical protein
VSAAWVQASLRRAFAHWGQPEEIQEDNGHPWGATGGLPTDLELWAAGLGVSMIHIPPRRPQANGTVEQSQGTGKRWAEPWQCSTWEQLQARIDQEDRLQREEYPFREGQSRLQRYPELRFSGRAYSASWEGMFWDLQAALQVLAGRVVSRKVSKDGKVSLYDWGYSVGRAYQGEMLQVSFDAQTQEWIFRRRPQEEVRRHRAHELTAERIIGLRVSRERRN